MLFWSAVTCCVIAEASIPFKLESAERSFVIVCMELDCSFAMIAICAETAWLTAASCSAVNSVPLWAIAAMMAAVLLAGSAAAMMVFNSDWDDERVVLRPFSWDYTAVKSADRADC